MLRIIKNVIASDASKYIVSIILGLGLASLFRKVCKDRNCIIFKGPALDEIKDKIYNYNDKCYNFVEKSIKCNSKDKSVEFE
jgi:hypothetical protein